MNEFFPQICLAPRKFFLYLRDETKDVKPINGGKDTVFLYELKK